MLFIHDVMTSQPITVTPVTPLRHVMEEFDRHGFNAIPVVALGGELVGIVTKLDLLRALNPGAGVELRTPEAISAKRTETVMRRGVVTVEPGDPMVVAADLMVETRLRSLPVVERLRGSTRRLVGIVSQSDLLRGLRRGPSVVRLAPGLESSFEPS